MWDMDILQEKNINASVNTEESSFWLKIYIFVLFRFLGKSGGEFPLIFIKKSGKTGRENQVKIAE